jgi:hypothetical protein
MSNYSIQNNWAGKDALADSDPNKVISGDLFDVEFTAVQTALNSKADLNGSASQEFSATTAAAGTDTTQVATTAFVNNKIDGMVTDQATWDAGTNTTESLITPAKFAGAVDNHVSASTILTKIKTVDGASSGLDADKLDGLHGSAYALAASGMATTLSTTSLSMNTTYTNSTGKTMVAWCRLSGNGEYCHLYGYVNGTLVVASGHGSGGGWGRSAGVTLVIPNGASYKFGYSAGFTPSFTHARLV